jgi:hypothetical protein
VICDLGSDPSRGDISSATDRGLFEVILTRADSARVDHEARRSRIRVVVAVLLSAVVALAAPGFASARMAWSTPQPVSQPIAIEGGVRVVSDARGDTLVVWVQRDGTACCQYFYRWRPPGGAWTPVRLLGQSAQTLFDLGITPYGEATAVWADPAREIVTSTAWPGRPFAGQQVLDRSANGVGWAYPHLAVDDQGDAVAVWTGYYEPGPVRFAMRPAGHQFGAARTVSPSSAGITSAAMNPAGAAAIAWITAHGTRLSYRPPAGSFGPPEPMPVGAATVPVTAVASDGTAIVAGTGIRADGDASGGTTYAARLPVGGWQSQTMLDSGGFIEQVLAEPDGAVSFMFERSDGTTGRTTMFATREPDGRLLGPRAVSPPGSGFPFVAMDLTGDMLATWTDNSNGWGRGSRIAVADRPAGGVFGAQTVVSDEDSILSQAALIDGGDAVVAWTQLPGPVVEAAIREDPSAPPLPFPPAVRIIAAHAEKVDGREVLRLTLRCSERCAIRMGALVHAGNRVVAARGPATHLARRRNRAVSVPLSRELARLIHRARAAHQKAWASVSVTAAGRSPRPVTFTEAVPLPR